MESLARLLGQVEYSFPAFNPQKEAEYLPALVSPIAFDMMQSSASLPINVLSLHRKWAEDSYISQRANFVSPSVGLSLSHRSAALLKKFASQLEQLSTKFTAELKEVYLETAEMVDEYISNRGGSETQSPKDFVQQWLKHKIFGDLDREADERRRSAELQKSIAQKKQQLVFAGSTRASPARFDTPHDFGGGQSPANPHAANPVSSRTDHDQPTASPKANQPVAHASKLTHQYSEPSILAETKKETKAPHPQAHSIGEMAEPHSRVTDISTEVQKHAHCSSKYNYSVSLVGKNEVVIHKPKKQLRVDLSDLKSIKIVAHDSDFDCNLSFTRGLLPPAVRARQFSVRCRQLRGIRGKERSHVQRLNPQNKREHRRQLPRYSSHHQSETQARAF